MGDMFHQSNANQSVVNEQAGVSTRDVGGSVTTVSGHDNRLTVQSLDPAALAVAANAVHDALVSNTQTSLAAFQGFQEAIHVTGETAGQAVQLAASGAGSGATIVAPDTSQGGILTPSHIIWAGIALVGVVLAIGYLRK